MSERFNGHTLETGLLQRVRSWRDVFPPLGLLPALRVAGSPIYQLIWLATVGILSMLNGETWLPVTMWQTLTTAIALVVVMLPAAMTMRAGALYAAGRDEESLAANTRHVVTRFRSLLLVLFMPIACVAGLCVPIAALGLMDRLPMIGNTLSEIGSIVFFPLAMLVGLIGAGASIAIPIGWASVAIEKRSDAFDALSRGFEYLYRRPVQMTLYLFVGIVFAGLIGALAWCVAAFVSYVGTIVYAATSGDDVMPITMRTLLTLLPISAFLCPFVAMFGATYLLLRFDAGGQEVEDIAVSDVDRKPNELPSLKP